MTIKRGEEWGRRVVAPAEFPSVSSDADAARQPTDQVFALSAGDLWRSLGSPSLVAPGQPCTEVQIDAIEVAIRRPDGGVVQLLAASSVEIGSIFGRGAYLAVLNSGFRGDLNLAPRAHPNDGRLEVFELESRSPIMQRLMIRRRAATGSHLPHPSVTMSSTSHFACPAAGRRARLRVDGRDLGPWEHVSIVCRPDHWRLLV